MEALILQRFFHFLSSSRGKRMIHLRIKFKNKKLITLPIYNFERGSFKIILPVYENGEVVDIIQLNLPIQVIVNPSAELYRYLRMRGVI